MVFPETGKVDIRQFIWFRVVVNLKEDAKKRPPFKAVFLKHLKLNFSTPDSVQGWG